MHFDHPPPCPPTCHHCLAYDNVTRALCTQAPSLNSKWCPVHEELQAKLLKTYKRYTLAVESYDNSVLPTSLDAITSQDDLATLRRWSETCRQKWSLVRRVIVARAEHHMQFYAGGDWGHCLFVETLKEESVKLERFLRALDRQAYSITLARSSASWILSTPARPTFICDDGPGSAPSDSDGSADQVPLTPPPTPPLAGQKLPAPGANAAPTPNKSQRKAARRKAARQALPPSPPGSPSAEDAFFAQLYPAPSLTAATPRDLVARLRGYLEPPTDLPPSVRPETWCAVVSGLFRHVVLRVPALATLCLQGEGLSDDDDRDSCASRRASATFDSVHDLLDSLEGGIDRGDAAGLVEKLWVGLKFARGGSTDEKDEADEGLLGVGVLAEVFSNLFRPDADSSTDLADSDSASVSLLGGKAWKTAYEGEWSREAWDLFYQFIACPGCTLIATRSISTWSTNRRLAALGHYPAWIGLTDATSGMADKAFRLSRVVVCCTNAAQCGRKVKRIESKDKKAKGKGAKGKKTVFVEEWERAWVYFKLPVDDPRSLDLLDALASQPARFSVLARNVATDETTHSPQAPTNGCSTGRGCSCCAPTDIWLNRVRSGMTPVERKAARWSTTTYFPIDSVLPSLFRSSSPESRFQSEPFSDCYDCLVLDASPYSSPTHDSWTLFGDAVAQALLSALDVESVSELSRNERRDAVERGEMVEGEWERMCAMARPDEQSKRDKGNAKKVVYVCEDALTARTIFRGTD
ncbi:hypothetical protein JCM10212_001644 [Sporobolomyces blumeae]